MVRISAGCVDAFGAHAAQQRSGRRWPACAGPAPPGRACARAAAAAVRRGRTARPARPCRRGRSRSDRPLRHSAWSSTSTMRGAAISAPPPWPCRGGRTGVPGANQPHHACRRPGRAPTSSVPPMRGALLHDGSGRSASPPPAAHMGWQAAAVVFHQHLDTHFGPSLARDVQPGVLRAAWRATLFSASCTMWKTCVSCSGAVAGRAAR
jgi:hypothetical protein